MYKRFHEAPKSIFHEVQNFTDGDYALVHLFETDPEYLALFKEAVAKGREVILDSSTYELGKSFDMERYAYWIKELKPTYYIIPDSLENFEETRSNAIVWNREYRNKLPGKCIGVVQGKTYEELVSCYKFMAHAAKVDKIAISFDYSYYEKSFPHYNKLVSWCMGRVKLLGDFMRGGIIDYSIPVHLLGCALPVEHTFYNNSYGFIDSVDTSSPVSSAISYIKYNPLTGLHGKVPVKMCDMMNFELDKDQIDLVKHNIQIFKQFCEEDRYI